MLASSSLHCRCPSLASTRHFSRAAPLPCPTRTPKRAALWVVAAGSVVSSNDLKNGLAVEVDGVPYKVIEFLHVKPGKGAAFVRSKLKSFITGNTMEKTFRAGEMLTVADIMKRNAQFTYTEGDEYIFMDVSTYEETRLKRDEEWAQYLKEGTNVELMFFNNRVISLDPPQFMDLKVVETTGNIKGNTASGGGSKPAKLESGATVSVPLFIEVGESIKVDTRLKTYLSRTSSGLSK